MPGHDPPHPDLPHPDLPRHDLRRRLTAEAIGSFFLFAGVIGSGIMAENLAGGNDAIALLANTIATGAILYVIIAVLAPVSGAHFNPAVTLAFALRLALPWREVVPYILIQLVAGAVAVAAVHLMFDEPIVQFSTKARAGVGQWTGEGVATFGLVLTILLGVRYRPDAIPAAVALYITAAYWFTSSTSFANPAITVIRSLSDSFAGIAPANVPLFIAAQLLGTVLAVMLAGWMLAAPGVAARN